MPLPLWLHLCTAWYVGSNLVVAYKGWTVLPTFFAFCYGAGLIGGLGDHLEPYVPVEYHWVTNFMENYISKFLLIGLVAIIFLFCNINSLTASKKLRMLVLAALPVAVVLLYHPVDYNTDWKWHLVHFFVVHCGITASNMHIIDCIAVDKKTHEKSK